VRRLLDSGRSWLAPIQPRATPPPSPHSSGGSATCALAASPWSSPSRPSMWSPPSRRSARRLRWIRVWAAARSVDDRGGYCRYRRDNDALESRPSTQVLVIDADQGVRDGCQRSRSPHDVASRRRVAVDVHATPPTNASLTTRCRESTVGLL